MGLPTLGAEVSLNTENGALRVNFSVRVLPPANPDEGSLLLVSFSVKRSQPSPPGAEVAKEPLRRKKSRTPNNWNANSPTARENLQATIEEQQATNEELKSTNEELQSTNEELQSTNEELETSREELQSMNEETLTVNSELNNKIGQLSCMQNDLKNLMDNVSAGVVFLDYHLNIRSYTREAVKAYRLIARDVGRPLSDITSNLQGVDLTPELDAVLETLIPREREAQAIDGAWYLARMQPYRNHRQRDRWRGAVFHRHHCESSGGPGQIRRPKNWRGKLADGIINMVSEPLIVLDSRLKVVSANRSFLSRFSGNARADRGLRVLQSEQWSVEHPHAAQTA